MTDTRRRVKLYALNTERQWDDKGTGHVSSTYVERLKGISLLVRAESDGSLLLESKIQPDTAYQKQQETLIVWSEGENFDLALSFQERAGCDEIWEKICTVQGRDPSVEFTQEIVEESEDERCFDEMMTGSDAVPPIELPAAEIARLEEIAELVNSCHASPLRREKLAVAIENEGYIKKLLNVFHMCEDLENREGLGHLYEIFKNIFTLNKNALFEVMFAEDIIFDVVGCLEYDPALPAPKKHREYLKSIAHFHQVIKINNPELLSKIHQTYRVQYIQDVVLPAPSVFDENITLSTLSSFIFFNKVEIVSLIQDDEKFLTELFAQLTDESTEEETRKESVLFLKEFCTFSQTLQPQSRENFFKTLNTLGILPALEITLASDNRVTKSASIDILIFIVDFSPTMVREYMLQQPAPSANGGAAGGGLLMNVIIEQMTIDSDPELGGAVQLVGIIRTLLDPENLLASINKSEKTDFLNYFYKHCMHVFIAPLMANTANDVPERMDSSTVQLLSLILELLSFCVEHHTFHIKNYILHKDLLKRILVLMGSKHTFLVLCALRLMRKIIALKDEFYNRYIIRGNLFAPVIDAFISNDGRYNLLDSAILEMFEFIKMEDIKSLCSHVVESFGPTLDKITYVQTFKALKTRYDQHQDRLRERPNSQLEGVGSILRPGRFRRDQRDLDEDEEMWFNDDEYEGNGGASGPGEASSAAGAGVMGVGATAATLSAQQQQLQNGNVDAAKSGNNGLHDMGGDDDDEEDEDEEEAEEDAAAAQQQQQQNAKKGLVDYDGDSDEDDSESSSSSPANAATSSSPAAATATTTTTTSLATSTSSSSSEETSTSSTASNGAAVTSESSSSEATSAQEAMDTSSSSTNDAPATDSIEEQQPAEPQQQVEQQQEDPAAASASSSNPSSSGQQADDAEEQQNRDTASTASEAVAAATEESSSESSSSSSAQQQQQEETSSESVSTTEGGEDNKAPAPVGTTAGDSEASAVPEVEGKEAEAAATSESPAAEEAQEATEDSVSEGPAAKRPRTE